MRLHVEDIGCEDLELLYLAKGGAQWEGFVNAAVCF